MGGQMPFPVQSEPYPYGGEKTHNPRNEREEISSGLLREWTVLRSLRGLRLHPLGRIVPDAEEGGRKNPVAGKCPENPGLLTCRASCTAPQEPNRQLRLYGLLSGLQI